LGWAQQKASPSAPRGRILQSGTLVYEKPSFDAEVIAEVSAGREYEMSTRKFAGIFYRVRLRPNVIGYVADTDIKPLFEKPEEKLPRNVREAKRESRQEKERKRNPKPKAKPQRSFEMTRYFGLGMTQVQYKEEAVGKTRRENLNFLQFKLFGPNVLVEGPFPTEFNLMFFSGAPSYYEKTTGQGANGFILMTDFKFLNLRPVGPSMITHFGFGPVLRYSQFDVAVLDAGQLKSYSLGSMALGLSFSGGLGFRLGSLAARGELRYDWEKQQHLGFGANLQYAF
jgi:hypothetical protein